MRRVLTPTQAAELATRFANGLSKEALAKEYGVSRRTVYRVLSSTPERVRKRRLSNHGTNARYAFELRAGLVPCDKCTIAHAAYQQGYEAGRRSQQMTKRVNLDQAGT